MPIGSLPVETVLPGKSNLRIVTRLLSTADILALNATPLSIVAAEPGRILVPLMFVARAVKTGAPAWTTSPLLSITFEGNTQTVMNGSLAVGLNTAAPIDTLLFFDDISTASMNQLTFDRTGRALQVRSTVVPIQGAGANATITVSLAAISLST